MLLRIALAVATLTVQTGPAFARETEEGRVCYQSLCLLDPIQRLNLPVAKVEFKAKPGPQDAETVSLGRKILKADATVADILVRAGFIYGEPNSITQATLGALKKMRAVCGQTASSFQVHVQASGGRNVILSYKPITEETSPPGYRLTSMSIAYPEIQSASDKRELFTSASESMKLPFSCNDSDKFECAIGGASVPSAAEFYAGRFILRVARPTFDLEAVTRYPECKSQIKF